MNISFLFVHLGVFVCLGLGNKAGSGHNIACILFIGHDQKFVESTGKENHRHVYKIEYCLKWQ